jgi:O-antigen/teichoic acid export membrane protein
VAVAAHRFPIARQWRLVRNATHRLSWGIADQGMSSLTNFLLSAFVARSLGAAQFGAFSLAYVTYGFAINASRGLAIEPLLIRFSTTSLPTWRRATAGATGTALVVGLVGGILGLAVAPLIGGTTGQAFLALGLTLPGLLLQDSWRYAFFALGKGQHAFINDAVWAAVQIPALVLLKVTGHGQVFWFVLAWGGAAGVGAVVGSLQAKVLPSLTSAAQWLARHRDLGPRYLVENTGTNSVAMLRSYSVTSILGLSAVGDIQAASVLLGPFNIILFGVSIITIPEGARVLRNSPHRFPLFCAAVSTGLVLLAVPWTVGLLIAMPHGLGQLMLGNLWRAAYPLVIPTSLAVMASCAATGANLGLHALGAARRSLRGVLLTAGLVLVSGIVGALLAGTEGTLYFTVAAAWVGNGICWWQLRQALHETPQVSVPIWLLPGKAGHRQGGAAESAASEQVAAGEKA